jgi:hypothetical protein
MSVVSKRVVDLVLFVRLTDSQTRTSQKGLPLLMLGSTLTQLHQIPFFCFSIMDSKINVRHIESACPGSHQLKDNLAYISPEEVCKGDGENGARTCTCPRSITYTALD